MRRHGTLLAACAVLAFGATSATADCVAEMATLESGMVGSQAGTLSKDGTAVPLSGTVSSGAGSGVTAPADSVAANTGTAPVAGTGKGTTTNFDANSQTAADGSTMAAASGNAISKDGTTAPLAAEAGQPSTGVANSDQDAMAQQSAGVSDGTSSETTASVEPSTGTSASMMAALDKARAAKAGGDEAACMAALEEARGLAR